MQAKVFAFVSVLVYLYLSWMIIFLVSGWRARSNHPRRFYYASLVPMQVHIQGQRERTFNGSVAECVRATLLCLVATNACVESPTSQLWQAVQNEMARICKMIPVTPVLASVLLRRSLSAFSAFQQYMETNFRRGRAITVPIDMPTYQLRPGP